MKTRHGGQRYRIAVSGDVVIAQDTTTSTIQAYRKRKIEDGNPFPQPIR